MTTNEQVQAAALLPCPFCASVELIDDRYKIECKHCGGKSGFRTSYHREAWNSRATPAGDNQNDYRHQAAAQIETLTREKAALEQQLSQAGDNIELAEAEQRGFERGKKSAESALREALDVVRPFAKVAPLIEYLDNIEYITLGASKLLNAGMIRAARAFIEKHAPAAPSEDK